MKRLEISGRRLESKLGGGWIIEITGSIFCEIIISIFLL